MLATLFLLVCSALAYDHSPWQEALDKYRSPSGRVDYASLAGTGALDAYISGLASTTLPADKSEQMALWVNAYNAITVDLIAKNWPVSSIREIDDGKVWTTRRFTVAGQSLTLDQIEKQKLAAMGDPRVHVVLNCASLGCPPLGAVAMSKANIEAQLNQATRQWISGSGVTIKADTRQVQLSEIFDWYADDFPASTSQVIPGIEPRLQGPLQFIARHLAQPHAQLILAGGYHAQFIPFDWKVNAP